MWWHRVTHGRGSEGETGEWSEYPVPFTLPRNMVYPTLLPLMRTPQEPVVDRTDVPADLNRLVRFAERRNMVSARVPSHIKRSLPPVNNNILRAPLPLFVHESEVVEKGAEHLRTGLVSTHARSVGASSLFCAPVAWVLSVKRHNQQVQGVSLLW